MDQLNAALSPMVGLSHAILRSCIRDYLPAEINCLWSSEMLSSKRLISEKMNSKSEVYFSDDDQRQGFSPQILGNKKHEVETAIKKLQDWGAKSIDINMGCPVRKALQHNYGVSLMGDFDYAARIVQDAAQASSLPVSVKLRTGLHEEYSEEKLLQFLKKLESAGAQFLIIHPRIGKKKRRGSVNMSLVNSVAKQMSIPLWGNGDIQNLDDFQRLEKKHSSIQGYYIGRALCARPWLLAQIAKGKNMSLESASRSIPGSPHEEALEYAYFISSFYKKCKENPVFEPRAFRLTQFLIRQGSVWMNFGQEFSRKFIATIKENSSTDCILEQARGFISKDAFLQKETALRL